MERFVCDLKWQSRLGWAIWIATFVAIEVFGAPLTTILFVIVGELIFIAYGEAWYRLWQAHR